MKLRVFIGIAVAACSPTEPPTPAAEPPLASATAPAPPSAPLACPADMALIEGRFCPEADQHCLRHHPEYEADSDKSERCLLFAEPTQCVSKKRVLMRVCIDRYEWPNRKGVLPSVLVDFTHAKQACESAGKRLCNENEWLFACEGEDMRPYVTGFARDATACAIDRPYVERPRVLSPWDACQASPACREDFARLDQRAPSGSFERCVTPEGVYDLNGNVNEWVNLPEGRAPHRSGLKGGWWGPVRNRCRPTVRFHDESDWGYEIGFRCCRDAKP